MVEVEGVESLDFGMAVRRERNSQLKTAVVVSDYIALCRTGVGALKGIVTPPVEMLMGKSDWIGGGSEERSRRKRVIHLSAICLLDNSSP